MAHNRKVIYQLVQNALTLEEFNNLVFCDFPKVYDQFIDGQIQDHRIRLLIEYAEKHREIDILLREVKKINKNCFEEFSHHIIPKETELNKITNQEDESINQLIQYIQSLPFDELEIIYLSCRSNNSLQKIRDINEIITELNRIVTSQKYRPLIPFVYQIKNSFPKLKNNLQNWLQHYGKLFGYDDFIGSIPNILSATSVANSDSSLLIYIKERKVNYLKLEAWFWSYNLCKCIQESDIITISDGSNRYQRLSDKLNTLIQSSNYLMRSIGSENLRIEFFLSTTLLKELKNNDFDIDWLDITLHGYPVEICRQYPVIFRLAERLDVQYQSLRGDWKKRWENLESPTRSIIPFNHPDIKAKLGNLQTIGVMLDSISNCEDFFREICLQGLPIALWSRCDLETSLTTLEKIRTILDNNKNDFKQLPLAIKQERMSATIEECIGKYICLLWDDPERMPSDPKEPQNALMPI